MPIPVLRRPTLVLNRNWQPVNIATVARALVMLCRGTVRVVDPADYQVYTWEDWSEQRPGRDELSIRSPGLRLRVPEVITLVRYDRVPNNCVTFSRRNLFRRDRYMCQYCGHQPGSEQLTIDHVVPRAQDGASSWENCVLACLECNLHKADRTPRQASMRLRKTPTQPAWNPLYAPHDMRIESWSKFISEAYWNVELEH